MKLYDVYYKGTPPRLIRKGLTDKQMDVLWKELKWWEKSMIDVVEEKTVEEPEEER